MTFDLDEEVRNVIAGFESFSGQVRKQVSHILLSTIYGEVQEEEGERGRAGRERRASKTWFFSAVFQSGLRGRLAKSRETSQR